MKDNDCMHSMVHSSILVLSCVTSNCVPKHTHLCHLSLRPHLRHMCIDVKRHTQHADASTHPAR